MSIHKAIVTGGSGFIGSHLVDALIERGSEVTVVDVNTSAHAHPRAKYILHDIRYPGLNEIFSAVQPDVVFHLAAHIDDRVSVLEPVMNAEHNILGSLHVFEAARLAHAKKIMFASTSVVYGRAKVVPIRESAIPSPLTPYAISKLTAEQYLHFYDHQYGLKSLSLRLANVYGPRQDGSKECGAIAIFTRKLLAGEQPFMNNDGQTTRDYIHVSDVVAAFLAGADSEVTGVLNCGTKTGVTTANVYELVAKHLSSSVKPLPRTEIIDAVKHIALHSGAAKRFLGWTPKVKLNQGISETVAWYQAKV